MRRLRAAFARAERGEAGAVLLSGDAGVGKTRLLTALGEHARTQGALVLTGRCIDVRDGGLPYLPFAEALAPLAVSEDHEMADAVLTRPPLGRLLPQTQALPQALPQARVVSPAGAEHVPLTTNERETMQRPRPEQDLGQLQLFDAVLGVLAEVAEPRPVVLLLEDLRWADGSTRNLLSFLVSRLRAQPGADRRELPRGGRPPPPPAAGAAGRAGADGDRGAHRPASVRRRRRTRLHRSAG